VAPRTEIGVGMVGYGLAGRLFHAPFIDGVDGLRIRSIATSDPERRAQAGRDHPDVQIVGSVDALLANPDVEIVVVVTPNRFHAPIGTQALAADRHVVVDKPIAMTVREAEALIESGHRAGRILCVYQNRRWDGDYQTVRRLIADGALGEIDSLEARFERWMPVGPEWREHADEAGGPLRDLGAHLVDQSLQLFGGARRVWAQIDRRRPGTAVDDSTFVAVDHLDGVRSRLWMSLIALRTGPRLRVRGLAGEYVKDDLDYQEAQLFDGRRPGSEGFGEEPSERWGRLDTLDGASRPVPTERGRWIRFYELLRDAVRGEGEPPVDPADSVRVLRVLDAAERSAQSGAAQRVDGT
jgi:predicted dehydrogenase